MATCLPEVANRSPELAMVDVIQLSVGRFLPENLPGECGQCLRKYGQCRVYSWSCCGTDRKQKPAPAISVETNKTFSRLTNTFRRHITHAEYNR